MALTKAQLVESIQDQTRFPRNRSSELVETLLKIIKDALISGEDVLISNFGKFCVKQKDERKGRNPATGPCCRAETYSSIKTLFIFHPELVEPISPNHSR